MPKFSFQISGMNAGVGLMHLERMSKLGWNELWTGALEDLLFQHGHLIEGEQVMQIISIKQFFVNTIMGKYMTVGKGYRS